MNEWVAALILGFLGSFHCVGMCGPIAMMLPFQNFSGNSKIFGALLYNLGRVVTYAVIGFVFGMAGKGFYMAGLQQALSIVAGIVLILMALFSLNTYFENKMGAGLSGFFNKVKHYIGILFKQNSLSAIAAIGLLNGLLPCGLVYLGLAGALATGSASQGAVFMAAFGFGTFPAMLSMIFLGKFIGANTRLVLRKALPIMVFLMGALLLVRGLNLGIPYLSPHSEKQVQIERQLDCCKKP